MSQWDVPEGQRDQWIYAEQMLAMFSERALIRLVTKSFGKCLDAKDTAGAARWESLSIKIDALVVSSLRREGPN